MRSVPLALLLAACVMGQGRSAAPPSASTSPTNLSTNASRTLPGSLSADLWEDLRPLRTPDRFGMRGSATGPTPEKYTRQRTVQLNRLATSYTLTVEPGAAVGEFLVSFESPRQLPAGMDDLSPAKASDARGGNAPNTYLRLAEPPSRRRLLLGEQLDVPTVADAKGDSIMVHLILRQDENKDANKGDDGFRSDFERSLQRSINLSSQLGVTPRPPEEVNAPPQPLTGEAQDWTGAEPEIEVWLPTITLNGKLRYLTSSRATGTLPWIYLPGKGRYILSLLPHAELGFTLAGEVQSDTFRVVDGEDHLEIVASHPIFMKFTPYKIYLLREPNFTPLSKKDQERALVGTVSPRELEILHTPPAK